MQLHPRRQLIFAPFAPGNFAVRSRTPTPAEVQRHARGHPDIGINLLQEALALVTTSTRPRQHSSLIAHFYAAHFAPLLDEDRCGPPVDITAHHQVTAMPHTLLSPDAEP